MYPASFPQDSPGAGPRYQANNASTWKPPQPGGQAALAQLHRRWKGFQLMRELWNSSGVVGHTKLLRESWQVRSRQHLGSPTPKIQPKSQVWLYTHTISHHLTSSHTYTTVLQPLWSWWLKGQTVSARNFHPFFRVAKSHGMAGWIKYRKFTTHLTIM